MKDKTLPDEAAAPSFAKGTLVTIGLFLVGNTDAIRRLAATPRLWLACLPLTVSAGLAREYDGEDLLAEPWYLLIAPTASLAAATLLWLLVQLNGRGHWRGSAVAEPLAVDGQNRTRSRRWAPETFLPFLGLFWLTAPLAWLYGIPFERFLSPVDAATANLWMLALVATWRVVLMIRVLSVLWHLPWVLSSITVLLFGDVLLQIALTWLPTPIFDLMGGVRLMPVDQLILGATMSARIFGILALILLFAGWLICLGFRGQPWGARGIDAPVRIRALVTMGALACLWWIAWLPVTQPEQRLRHRIEQAMVQGDFPTGLTLLAQHHPQDLPPHWDPPPHLGYPHPTPDPLPVLLHMTTAATPAHLQRRYEEKLLDHSPWWRGDDPRTTTLVTLLERQADASFLMGRYHEPLTRLLAFEYSPPQPALAARIKALLARYPAADHDRPLE